MNNLDIRLERLRERIGALVLLIQDSSPTPRKLFSQNRVLGGVLYLMDREYARREGEDCYILTNKGWVYARKVLTSIRSIL